MNKRALTNLNRGFGYYIGLIGCLLVAPPAQSQTNAPRFGTISSRFLLIVETSRPMGHRKDATVKAVTSLLYSGFSHQIKQGDTLGVWTYNQQLYTGRMPLQRWSTPMQHELVSSTLDFLKSQKYEKQPAFSSVRPALDKVIKDSEFITVIFISSGLDAMSGTPFDDKINEFYKSWKVDQEKARMPFITVLRAKRGTITGYAAVPVPWQVDMPAWPAETNAAPAVLASSSPKVQPSPVQALVFTGKKPKPAETTNSSETVATTPESAPPASATPVPAPAANSAVSEPSHVLPTPPAPDSALIERKVQQSETPQHPPDPAPTAPSDPVASSPTAKAETPSPPLASSSNASNPAPAETAHKSTPPPQEIPTGVAVPGSSLLSNKIIWLAGLAALGITCVFFIVLARRPRSEHISLITRSLEREGK
jgi:hypothetical protein